MDREKYLSLGKTEIKISQLGLGTMQWGNRGISNLENHNIHSLTFGIYKTSLDVGINFFDTAEIYGFGKSENYLGLCYRKISENVVIASKFMPFPWRLSKGELRKALTGTLNRLGIKSIDLYQIHWPFPPVSINSWMDAMADVVDDGLVRAVGVSNFSIAQTQKAFDQLAKRRITLASNQIKFNLLDRVHEKSGLVKICHELGITIIAYSPLEVGILTGKYSQHKLPPNFRAWRYNRSNLKKIEPLLQELTKIGNKYNGKTPGQVSLNWLILKGVVAIPGAKNVIQAKENAGAIGWKLTQDDIDRLDFISNKINI